MFDLTDFCRVCTRAECPLIDIYTADEDNMKLSEKLSYCVTEAINEDDVLPNLICEHCCKNLRIAYTFKKICLKTRSVLCGYFSKAETKNIESISGPESILQVSFKEEQLSDEENNYDCKVNEKIKIENIVKVKINQNMVESKENTSKICVKCDIKFVKAASDCDDNELCSNCTLDSASYVCSVCNYRFNKNIHLQAHMRAHTGEKPYPCEVCNASFAYNHHLTRHMKLAHAMEKNNNYYCRVCNMLFINGTDLQIHFKQYHDIQPDFEDSDGACRCPVCQKGFNNRSSMLKHISHHQRSHNIDKTTARCEQICPVCEKTFKGRHKLTIHMRVHTGERPYTCDTCGKCFTQSGYLSYHMRIHTGEKPYHCHICGKNFTQKTTLGTHMRVHTTTKSRLSCPICKKRVSYDSTLRRHIKILHGWSMPSIDKFFDGQEEILEKQS